MVQLDQVHFFLSAIMSKVLDFNTVNACEIYGENMNSIVNVTRIFLHLEKTEILFTI